ncbi:MAG TPA: RNA polymerase-binding protein DksA [Anaeromyxobacteraceae bacterium]|nr:RNA polymerase-binding protein DksA [Anaeromyxobacteraceae bacterium]
MRRLESERFRRALSAQLAVLLGHGEDTVHELRRRRPEELPDPTDRASLETDRSRALRLRDRDRRLIGKIQQALERLEAGTFGVCEACGGPISAARLRARPVATFCIDCKREAERQGR